MNDGKITLQIVGWADLVGGTMVISDDAREAYDEYVGVIEIPSGEMGMIELIEAHQEERDEREGKNKVRN